MRASKVILHSMIAGCAAIAIAASAGDAKKPAAKPAAPAPAAKPASPAAAPAKEAAPMKFDHAVSFPEKIVPVRKTDAEWRKLLTAEQYHITREAGTERACSGGYWNKHDDGFYLCSNCALALYDSKTKFESGTGWPSFFKPIKAEYVVSKRDYSHGMVRDEVVCGRCEAHLGHVFEDGPPPTGLRFCINSGALSFIDRKLAVPAAPADAKKNDAAAPASAPAASPAKPEPPKPAPAK